MEQAYRPDKDLRDALVIISSTTTALGTNLTLTDSVLTEGDDYWNNMAVVILSGNSKGQTRRISDFDAASDTVTVDTAFASVIASGTKYNIVAQHAPLTGVGDATAANQVLILADTATIKGDTQVIEDSTLKAAPTAGSLARFVASGGTALGTELPDSKSLYDCLSGGVTSVNRVAGNMQVVHGHYTNAANAGDLTIFTIMSQFCIIKSVILRGDTAVQTANLTSVAITGGGALGKTVTFISDVQGVRANLAATDNQVWWSGDVSLPTGADIIMTLTGTGGDATDLTVDISYYAVVNGGYLS